MASKTKSRKFAMGVVTAVAASLMVFSQVGAANAAVHTGSKGCAGQYGNVKGTTTGYTELTAPGS